jgi:hypothetical protein
VKLLDDFIDANPSEAEGMRLLVDGAIAYISKFRWCRAILEYRVGIGIPTVIGVFLMRIEPAESGVDDWLWVVVGDVPPAYLVVDDNPTPADALDAYIIEMRQWVDAVRIGASIDDLIPVNAPPTMEFADMLASRLEFLSRVVLPESRRDFKA